MSAPALLIRLRPVTPWRLGPANGASGQTDAVLHSDTVYSAVTSAMRQLGVLEEWLNATAGASLEPAVRFSSGFPFQRGVLFAPAPAGLWPPPVHSQAPSKIRWKSARFLALSAVSFVLRGEELREESWVLDPQSACLLPSASKAVTGPFRILHRSSVAVDRLTGSQAAPHSMACVQFAPGSGLWCAAQFSSQATFAIWAPRVQAAFRLLADNGLGGARSRGFGRSRAPEFQSGRLAEMLFPAMAPAAGARHHWLLSLYSPAENDPVVWDRGNYTLVAREGRTAGDAPGQLKLTSRMVAEGSVLEAGGPVVGCIRDVAPAGSPHPVYRAGFAVSIPIAWRAAV
jgi:CRISPR type III-A-associated RAMP protein Csm4